MYLQNEIREYTNYRIKYNYHKTYGKLSHHLLNGCETHTIYYMNTMEDFVWFVEELNPLSKNFARMQSINISNYDIIG